MPPKQKRKRLTLGQKKQLIADKYAGSLIDDLKKKFGIGKTAVYDTINNRKAILKQVQGGTDPKNKNMKLDENPTSEATLSWLAFWFSIVPTFFWLAFIIVIFIWLPIKAALVDSVILITSAFINLLITYRFWKQNAKFKRFVDRAYELNSKNGHQMSFDQAYTLFKLHNYRKTLSQVQKLRESRKSKRFPRTRIYFSAMQFNDYFKMSRWINELQQQETITEADQKVIGEMQERLQNYDLLMEERCLLDELAKLNELRIPEEEWKCEESVEPLNVNEKV